MKGKISLNEFIRSVKTDIMSSLDSENPFFEITKVQLEASFAVSIDGEAGFNLYVIDATASAEATQTHKVVIDLTPIGSGDNFGNRSGTESILVTRASGKGISVRPIRGPLAKRAPSIKPKAEKQAIAKLKKAARKATSAKRAPSRKSKAEKQAIAKTKKAARKASSNSTKGGIEANNNRA